MPLFRWDLAHREQLGRLVAGETVPTYRGFHDDLRMATAKGVARTLPADLVFVGRSVENLFDYLSGLFADLPYAPRLTLLPFSSPGYDAARLSRDHPREVAALLGHLEALGIDPAAIVARGRRIRFVDLVRTGNSLFVLFDLLRRWCRVQSVEWRAVTRLTGILGFTWRTKNSPNTWRWQQNADWLDDFPPSSVVNVSLEPGFWSWMGNHELKTTPSFTIDRWASGDGAEPNRHEWHLQAMRFALSLYERGRTRAERLKFSAALTELPEMRDREVRALVTFLRGR
jgi:hypothetical protein